MQERIYDVYAKLDTPIEDDPTRADRIIHNGQIYRLYGIIVDKKTPPPPGEGWELVKAIRKRVEGRRAHIYEVITHQE